MDVEKYGQTKGCPSDQKVTRRTVPSCIVATHSGGYRERMARLTTQDPVGADREDRTETRHDEAFAEHVEEHDEREKKIARHSHDAQGTTHNQPSSSSSSGAIRADSNVQGRQENKDSVCTSNTQK